MPEAARDSSTWDSPQEKNTNRFGVKIKLRVYIRVDIQNMDRSYFFTRVNCHCEMKYFISNG